MDAKPHTDPAELRDRQPGLLGHLGDLRPHLDHRARLLGDERLPGLAGQVADPLHPVRIELVAKLGLCLAISPSAPLDGQGPVAGEPPLEKRGDSNHRD